MYKRMLVPLDGSELAEEVFPYAREIASRMDLDLVFLNVCNPDEIELFPMRESYVDQVVEMVSCQTSENGTVTRTSKIIKSLGVVTIGYPADEILKYAEERQIDIIMMATHGDSGVRRWAIGSTAYQVLHASKTPVLLVRNGMQPLLSYER